MEFVAVPVRVVGLFGAAQDLDMVGEIGEVHVLGETVSDIDTETVGTAVEPETQDRTELLANLGVGPVEVRLTRVEQVEVPLAVVDLGPGRTTEDRFPVVRRTDRAVVGDRTLGEVEAGPLRRAGSGLKRGLEPDVIPAAVVGHQIDQDADPELVGFLDHRVGVLERAVRRVDVAVVGHVVAAVEQG